MNCKARHLLNCSCIYFCLSLIPGLFFGGHFAVTVFALLWIPHALLNNWFKNGFISSSYIFSVGQLNMKYDDVWRIYTNQTVIVDNDGNIVPDVEYIQFITPYFLDPLLPAFHVKGGKLIKVSRADAITHWSDLTKQYKLDHPDDKK